MEKNRYSVDQNNRLVVRRGKTAVNAEGGFELDKRNNLVYILNEPPDWRRRYGLGERICFDGRWKLDGNYDLVLAVSENKHNSARDRIVLKGEIISGESDSLAFEIKSRNSRGNDEFRILRLSGAWSADPQNNLVFTVDRSFGADTLKLGSAWKLNQDHQVVFTYRKTALKRSTRIEKELVFLGSWQIMPDKFLRYAFSMGERSRFDFRAQIEPQTIYPQKGKIKFRLGAGARRESDKTRIISLYGAWKFSRELGLDFVMDYGKGGVRKLEFNADIDLTPKDKVILGLVTREREPLGVKLTLSHKFLKKLDAEAFLTFKALREEKAIESGITIPF